MPSRKFGSSPGTNSMPFVFSNLRLLGASQGEFYISIFLDIREILFPHSGNQCGTESTNFPPPPFVTTCRRFGSTICLKTFPGTEAFSWLKRKSFSVLCHSLGKSTLADFVGGESDWPVDPSGVRD
jgi:hypothetical protein